MRQLFTCALLFLASCDGDPPPADGGGGEDADTGPTCPRLDTPQAMPGDPIEGDTWETYASGFFESYCIRCHASTRSGAERNGAPEGFDWDRQPSVLENLSAIRSAVGVTNFMPPNAPKPSCEERARLVRWIDAGAP